MTVCSNRTDTPGFFRSCWEALGRKHCVCGEQVAAELIARSDDNSTTNLDTQENP